MNDDGDPIFQFSSQEGRLSMVISEGWQLHSASEKVAKSLGYMHNLIYRGLDEPSNRYFASLNKSVDIAYIYCDICEYSPVGDVMAPLLRAIPLKWNEPTVHRFDNIHYINLMSNRFHTIRIEICTDLGKEIVFPEGISLIKLHIRTKKKMTQE